MLEPIAFAPSASISRELRTPLTSIHGSLRLVAAGALGPIPPEASALLAIAGRHCARLLGVIDDLLDCDQNEGATVANPLTPLTPLRLAARVREALGIV
jgi:signal transduction histidine kinase